MNEACFIGRLQERCIGESEIQPCVKQSYPLLLLHNGMMSFQVLYGVITLKAKECLYYNYYYYFYHGAWGGVVAKALRY
jgi:hypothetical protein